ncbi:MAG: hypothetical protein IPP07_08995 [Holophagales bacterium]|nr:hypothetical protein [Holophagales bacterium]
MTPRPKAARRRLSVGWKVPPKMWKRRVARSRRMAGAPPMEISGRAKKVTKRPYAIARRTFQNRPSWTIGCMNFRLPSAEML